MEIKFGSIVKCIEGRILGLTKDKLYTVVDLDGQCVYVIDDYGHRNFYSISRFVLDTVTLRNKCIDEILK